MVFNRVDDKMSVAEYAQLVAEAESKGITVEELIKVQQEAAKAVPVGKWVDKTTARQEKAQAALDAPIKKGGFRRG